MWFFYFFFVWPVIYISSSSSSLLLFNFCFFFYCNKIIRSIFISSSYTLIIIRRRVCVCACDRDQSTSHTHTHTHTQTVWKKRTLHWWNICLIFESIDFFVFLFSCVQFNWCVFVSVCLCVCKTRIFFSSKRNHLFDILEEREKKNSKQPDIQIFFCCCWLSSLCNAFITES